VKRAFVLITLVAWAFTLVSPAQADRASQKSAYFGFDRNEYPGDANLKTLRQSFSFAGYWLNNPPGANTNTWAGKRKTLQAAGFGFLVVFNGHTYKEIKAAGDAKKLGASEGAAAVAAARHEGFRFGTIIFLDQEEGGRMLAEQRAYLHAWIDAVTDAGFRPGVYCSGIPAKEESNESIITAEDIRKNAEGRNLSYWVSNDACPPSPGCKVPFKGLVPAASGLSFVDVWQYAQSPRRDKITNRCAATYSSKDRSCYPPGITQQVHIDLNVANSPDPSEGRTRE
jgi:Rv2525c-like, glycoside hydrolase-like domain